jgi:hypothetical protein
VFLPWFLHDEYTRQPPSDWNAPETFAVYGDIYKLSKAQLYWAWLTNRELSVVAGGGPDEFNWKFRQEFPANADEAFQTSGANHFIKPEVVLKARKSRIDGYGPIILGVDPARGGNDKMGVVDRQGRRIGGHICQRLATSRDQRANAGAIAQIVKKLKAQGLPLRKVAVDCSDGGGLFDILRDVLGDDLVTGVMFGERAYDPEHYANRRAEMWDLMRRWYDDPAGVRVPDSDSFQGDMTCTAWGPGQTHFRPNGQLVMEEKDKIRARVKFSPDEGDAAALTFSVDYSELQETTWTERPNNRMGADAWQA